MKRLIIVCEGQTEQEFCKHVLSPYLIAHNIHIQAPLIKRTGGGIVKWSVLKGEIERYLYEQELIVTTLIDYYGINKGHKFPKWEEGESIIDKEKRMDFLENAIKEDISESLRYRFLPYFQLHEFEGLLFNDIEIFYENIPKSELVGRDELIKTFQEFDNPEMINDNRETSPGHRLQRIIKGYNKPLYGHYLAEAIGIERIRSKSPRFNNWIEKLISIRS